MSQSQNLWPNFESHKNATLYRCEFDLELVRESEISSGKHVGHKLKLAHHGSFFEWIKIQYWKLTGGL